MELWQRRKLNDIVYGNSSVGGVGSGDTRGGDGYGHKHNDKPYNYRDKNAAIPSGRREISMDKQDITTSSSSASNASQYLYSEVPASFSASAKSFSPPTKPPLPAAPGSSPRGENVKLNARVLDSNSNSRISLMQDGADRAPVRSTKSSVRGEKYHPQHVETLAKIDEEEDRTMTTEVTDDFPYSSGPHAQSLHPRSISPPPPPPPPSMFSNSSSVINGGSNSHQRHNQQHRYDTRADPITATTVAEDDESQQFGGVYGGTGATTFEAEDRVQEEEDEHYGEEDPMGRRVLQDGNFVNGGVDGAENDEQLGENREEVSLESLRLSNSTLSVGSSEKPPALNNSAADRSGSSIDNSIMSSILAQLIMDEDDSPALVGDSTAEADASKTPIEGESGVGGIPSHILLPTPSSTLPTPVSPYTSFDDNERFKNDKEGFSTEGIESETNPSGNTTLLSSSSSLSSTSTYSPSASLYSSVSSSVAELLDARRRRKLQAEDIMCAIATEDDENEYPDANSHDSKTGSSS